jgi:hypothetical protein
VGIITHSSYSYTLGSPPLQQPSPGHRRVAAKPFDYISGLVANSK